MVGPYLGKEVTGTEIGFPGAMWSPTRYLLLDTNLQPPGSMSNQRRGSPVCLEERSKQTVRLLGKSHVLEVIWCLVNAQGPMRFNHLRRDVDVTATTLSRRLEEMADLGLVSRTVYPEVPARVEYALTERGEGLTEVMRGLWDWIDAQRA